MYYKQLRKRVQIFLDENSFRKKTKYYFSNVHNQLNAREL